LLALLGTPFRGSAILSSIDVPVNSRGTIFLRTASERPGKKGEMRTSLSASPATFGKSAEQRTSIAIAAMLGANS
jgi:hypothetical protein